MKIKIFFAAIAVSLTLTGCGLYKKYESKAEIPADVIGTNATGTVPGGSADETTVPEPISWREFFTDPKLQQLIEQVLAKNTDLNSARIAVEKSEASLKAARLAYLPALSFAPQGSLSSFDLSAVSKTYNLPLQLSWDVEVFGSITNKKRASKAVLLQAQCSEEAVRSNLVSAVAQQYSLLQVLDRQLEILIMTDSLWAASLETQKSLWENGKAYSTAVNQMESSWLSVKTQIVDTRRNIHATELAMCRLMAVTPQHIERTKWGKFYMPVAGSMLSGFSAEMLRNRPDIRMADHVMEEAFYNTKVARAAFFPSLNLSGTIGWTNNAGSAIVNPGKLLLSLVGQLAQPIFNRGKIKANYKIAQLTEEDMQRKYVQTVIDAGNQVNEALADCQASVEKHQLYHQQVAVLQDAYTGTHELMDNGKANYLEVLKAQESLLSAQLSEAMNMYDGAQAVIALYIALGGGIK